MGLECEKLVNINVTNEFMRKKATFPGIRSPLYSVFEGFICISDVYMPSVHVWNHHSVIRDFSDTDRPPLAAVNHSIPLQSGKIKIKTKQAKQNSLHADPTRGHRSHLTSWVCPSDRLTQQVVLKSHGNHFVRHSNCSAKVISSTATSSHCRKSKNNLSLFLKVMRG